MASARAAARPEIPEPTIATRIRECYHRAVKLGGHDVLISKPRGAKALYMLGHGAGAGMDHWFMEDLAAALAARKIATLRYQFPIIRAPQAEATVREVWNAAAPKFRALPRFAGGKSFGGRMTSRAHAADPLPDLRGIAFVGFPLHPPGKPGVERADHLAQAAGPLLFVQGTRDDLADLSLLRPIVARLGERATLHVIDGADHGFSKKLVPVIAGVIDAWIDRTLDS